MKLTGTSLGLDTELLVAMLEADHDVVVVSDTAGRVHWVSPSVQDQLGWHPEQFAFVGTHLVHPSDQSIVEASLAVAATTPGHHHLGEIRHLRSDGDWVRVEMTMINLVADHGVMVTRYRDLSERGRHHHDGPVAVDELTGLPTRGVVVGELDHRLQDRGNVAVLFVDLDGFKGVNDRYGHAAGDEILKQVTSRLSSRLRASEVLSRWGGDEFVVLVEVPGPALAATVAARLRGAVVDEPFIVDSTEVRLGLSIGLALGHEGDDPEQLIARADEAMYRAKREGGGVQADLRSVSAA